jgi:hypothetical protein
MPSFNDQLPTFKPGKKAIAEWKTFKKGLNLILRPTELGRNEMSQADNIMLTGSGVPTGRWGTPLYFTAGATGTVRGLGTYIQGTTNEVLSLTDDGYLTKKNGTSYTRITGQSWASGSIIRTEQLGGETYIVSSDRAFTKYAGTNLSIYATISAPTGVVASNISGVTGPNRVSYKIVADTPYGGHTEPSQPYVLTGLPNDLTLTSIKVFWSMPSAATVSGFEIYRGLQGDETFLSATDGNTTSYVDVGADASVTLSPPITNTTGGVKSAFIKKYQNRLLVVDKDHPNTLMISALYPDHASFSLMDGGGSIDIDPDSGDDISGIEVQPIVDRIVVYKEHSSYLVKLNFVTLGSFYLLNPSSMPISTSVGCCNQGTIATVENDTFYFGRNGIYVTGYEPNYMDIIRTNEISARLRPFLDNLSNGDYETACAFYVDHKYILSFPQIRKMIVYDRERGSFAGIWLMPYGISHMMKFVDESGTERWVLGSYDDNKVFEFSRSVNTDNGTAIVKTLRTNKEDFGDWTVLSVLEFFYALFRAVTGEVTVNFVVEDRAGNNYNAKTFTITGAELSGNTGWGVDLYGMTEWGDTEMDYFSVSVDEVPRWGTLFKQVRSVLIEVTSSGLDGNWELLKAEIKATPEEGGILSSSQRV